MKLHILSLYCVSFCSAILLDKETRSVRQPIDLDPSGEYSAEDFKALFSGHYISDRKTELDRASGNDNIQSDVADKQSAIAVDMRQTATFNFLANCEATEKTTGQLIVDVRYDGHNVYYKSHQNIDSFGPYTSGGGGRYPVVSTARYHHTACRAVDENTFCSYYYHSTVKVTISMQGTTKGIEIGTFQAGEGGPDREGYVVETCVAMNKLPQGKKSPCPKPTGKRCTLGEIQVIGWRP